MSVLYILIPAALVLGLGFLAAFVWMLRRGQYDDLDTPPVRMLFDDQPTGPGKTTPPPPGSADQSSGQCSRRKRKDPEVSRRIGGELGVDGGRTADPSPGCQPGP